VFLTGVKRNVRNVSREPLPNHTIQNKKPKNTKLLNPLNFYIERSRSAKLRTQNFKLRMKILFHINHPAQYHLFKQVITRLKEENHAVLVIARNKDVLTQLLHNDGVEFINTTHRTDRESNLFSLFINFILQYRKVKKCCKEFQPDLMLGTSFTLPWISKRLKVPFLNFVEDDGQVIPLYSKLSFPFSTHIVTPYICQLGKWEKKKIGYNGYHELAFLRPEQFKPSREIAGKYINLEKKNFLLRFTAFNSHHDYGKRGVDEKTAKKVVDYLEKHGNIVVSSEKPLDSVFDKYRLSINPNDIHHVMAHCNLVIGDSQSMAMEAACLGIPSIRLNDYAGRISVLEELEKRYHLTHSYSVHQKDAFFEKIKTLVEDTEISHVYQSRKNKMLKDKIDVNKFIYWLVSSFPQSIKEAKDQKFMQSMFGGKIESPTNYKLRKGKSQGFIWFFAFYFLTLLFLYVVPLEGGFSLNKFHFSGFRLDHILHTLLFIPTAFVIAPIFLRQTQFRVFKIIALSFLIAALFETIHLLVSYRAFTIEDLLSNLLGVAIGSGLFILFKKINQ
jgi:predicted glycosyltransferase/VanZ family protein